jgi:hypothetical protein
MLLLINHLEVQTPISNQLLLRKMRMITIPSNMRKLPLTTILQARKGKVNVSSNSTRQRKIAMMMIIQMMTSMRIITLLEI